MEKLNSIFDCKYNTSKEAIEHCQLLALCSGFNIRIRTSKHNTIYIVCSREGRSDNSKPDNRRRNRFSDRCQCMWRVVLFRDNHIDPEAKWEFRSGKVMVHNHTLLTPKDIQSKIKNSVLKDNPTFSILNTKHELRLPSLKALLEYNNLFNETESNSDKFFNKYPYLKDSSYSYSYFGTERQDVNLITSESPSKAYNSHHINNNQLVCYSHNSPSHTSTNNDLTDFSDIMSKDFLTIYPKRSSIFSLLN